jgi:hypothetical protein
MTSAQVRGAALALALGIAGVARADANAVHFPAGSETCFRPDASVGDSFGTFRPSSPNIAVDPSTGVEVYLPTGETVDQVLPVVAARIPQPAVASVGNGAGTPGEACEGWCWETIVYQGVLPGGALLALGGWLLLRRRRGAGVTGSAPRIGTGLVL